MTRCAFVIIVLALGCGRDDARGTPRADCKLVGETLATLDLGSAAEPQARAPIVAKYQAACDQAHVSKAEGDCVASAKDKWSAGQCAPRMFPELASSNSRDCKQVIAKLEGVMTSSVGADNPQTQRYVATTLRVMQQSCEQDAWPDAVKQCVLTTQGTGGADAMQACNQQFPPALQSKLQERMQAAMREQTP